MKAVNKYQGARFFKCDLQMQTPADSAHWMGESFDMDKDPVSAARAFIERCYEVGLEVIGITDHNFMSKDFIPLLQAEAKKQASNYELIIFPGFELTANVGKGVHALALFPPNTDLAKIDHILTECGVPMPRQMAGSNQSSKLGLENILDIVQVKNKGVVILPHIQSNDGIFDKSKVAEWMQRSEFQNKDLLAVEIPKSVSKMNVGFQRLFANGEDCEVSWKRIRPIAKIMSSDCKALRADEGAPNFIGCRYTWIRMSEPSIESLRQAFLDEGSRIRISDDSNESPDTRAIHPYISRLRVSGADFLADTEIHFSPNFNALIGGRGTGKSSIVEYLRVALGRSGEVHETLANDFFSLIETIREGGEIEVEYNKGGDRRTDAWVLKSINGDDPTVSESSDIGAIDHFFPVKIFSRGQIEAIANDPDRQRQMLDELSPLDLMTLNAEEARIVGDLLSMNVRLSQERRFLEERTRLTASARDLQIKVNKVREKASALENWSSWVSEAIAIDNYEGASQVRLGLIQELIDELPVELEEFDGETPNASYVNEVRQAFIKLSGVLQTDLAILLKKYQTEFEKIVTANQHIEWKNKLKLAEEEYDAALASLSKEGVDPDLHKQNVEDLRTVESRQRVVQSELALIENTKSAIREKINSELCDVWERQYQVRLEAAERLNRAVPKTSTGGPTVKCSVVKHGDEDSFIEMMARIHQDRRRVSDSDWVAVLKAAFSKSLSESRHPVLILEEWIRLNQRGEKKIPGFPNDVASTKLEAISVWMPTETVNSLLSSRVPDAVTIALHRREDGKKVGELAGRNLSAGQKSTTVLSLLLAAGSEPILIDQPEDDLDNEFVYDQLVPILRATKETRQIIVVTHNANIPVNGDSELIIPLEVRDSRGCLKIIDGTHTIGGLDKRRTQDAVELILEGSADAFRRRHEKYGF